MSIVICFYDGQASQQAIRSIGSRTLSDFECVIIDDGSTDNSAALTESHARHDPRIVVVHQKNIGLIGSLNGAVGMPRAAVVARITTRDIAVPSRLEGQVDAMRRDRAALHSCVPHIVTPTGQVRAVIGTYADTDFAPLVHPALQLRGRSQPGHVRS